VSPADLMRRKGEGPWSPEALADELPPPKPRRL
jgi:hypothetical protein